MRTSTIKHRPVVSRRALCRPIVSLRALCRSVLLHPVLRRSSPDRFVLHSFAAGCLLALFLLTAGCEKDNYEPPASTLTGRVVYQGEPMGVRSNGVQLELWQPGYQQFEKIPVFVAQDGSFSASLFDGDYKLVLLRGNGPWEENTDTIDVQVSGATTVDVPVEPYYVIGDAGFSQSGGTVTANFRILEASASRPLESVTLFIGTTTIVDANNNAANLSKAAADIGNVGEPVTLSLELPAELAGRAYVFVRVGVKTTGVAEMLYSQVEKIGL